MAGDDDWRRVTAGPVGGAGHRPFGHERGHQHGAADVACEPSCPKWPAAATDGPPAASGGPVEPGSSELSRLAEEARRSRMAAALEDWWTEVTQREIQGVVPKAIEYSATDLEDIGRQLASFAGWTPEQMASGSLLTELGIAFYVVGKVGRVMGALREGRAPSDDTWHDIAVYTKMAQRVRDVGAWPGV